jgi:NAD+ synthetase
MPVIDTAGLIEERVGAIRDYHRRTGIARAELDVSGGVDSAVLLNLLERALGADHVTAAYIGVHSGDEFRQRAVAVAEQAGVKLVEIDVTDLFDALVARMLERLDAAGHDGHAIQTRLQRDRTVLGSIRSCLRAPIGRGFNRLTGGGVRHGTGNECEDRFLRFYQKGGDGEVDTNPIAMLSKGEVFQLGRVLGVPRRILVAKPSPDLHAIGEVHTDEDELRELTGVHWTYSQVDADSGEYTYVGNIERMSRFVDEQPGLFGAAEPDWDALVTAARSDRFSHTTSDEQALEFLRSARKLEAGTRHKWNPNCPALGDRVAQVAAGLLTDELPVLAR